MTCHPRSQRPADPGELGVQVMREVLTLAEDQEREGPNVDRVARAAMLLVAVVAVGVDRAAEAEDAPGCGPRGERPEDGAAELPGGCARGARTRRRDGGERAA